MLSRCAVEELHRNDSGEPIWNVILRTRVTFSDKTVLEQEEEERDANRDSGEKLLSVLTNSIVDGQEKPDTNSAGSSAQINKEEFNSDDPVVMHGVVEEEENEIQNVDSESIDEEDD